MAPGAKRMTRWDLAGSPSSLSTSLRSPIPLVDLQGNILTSAVQASMTAEQKDAYAAHFRVQEITTHLRLPDAALLSRLPPRGPRETSPASEYDGSGIRTNTRVRRRRAALERERHHLVARLTQAVPRYQPPADYRALPAARRLVDRLFIPQREHPEVKFIGQILGPRGRDLRKMEEQSGGASIAIRGKGSVKEGKAASAASERGRRRHDHQRSTNTTNYALAMNTDKCGDDDGRGLPLHVLITADAQDKVDRARKLVQQVIDDAVSKPDWLNERKQQQLRGVAEANGTLRDDEGLNGGGSPGAAHRRGWGLTFGVQRNGNDANTTSCPMKLDTLPASSATLSDHDNHNATIVIHTDQDEELERLMRDIDRKPACPGEQANAGQHSHNFATIPPWRIDRMRRQGFLNL
ncbi:hypothetical protein Micbo1qcDRAFT_211727 [Microdochium bolleyi]|uniref:Branchpoint-bridging protein n=1 Tax=Microdochium bolleyi TaxID=196109 RepID=A0A136JJZ7_9PEZI|nr:hypothetical protein Micbo1qcDRAFT_211727 [Microdochium bolleyi]